MTTGTHTSNIPTSTPSSVLTALQQQHYQRTLMASDYAVLQCNKFNGVWQQDIEGFNYYQQVNALDINQWVQQTVNAVTLESMWMQRMRQLRARLMLRWIWRDANGLCTVLALTQELSYFADASITAAVNFAKSQMLAKYGEPIGDDGKVQSLIVFALGKLGGMELNLSSDIDLVFAYDDNGDSTGVDGKHSIAVQQYCIQWGQMVIRLLDQVTADGFVFRVDMRLRPWGDGSPLAVSYVALERYLEQHGRDWERYAWIKARLVCGQQYGGTAMLQMTRAFVYRQYIDYSVFDAIREMKVMIERELQKRDLANDVKLGRGGIREIEFIVQAYQLIYGGSSKDLQINQCLPVLHQLVALEMITQAVADQLAAAYVFLRRLEHAIQAINDQQTQLIPSSPELRTRIAHTLNFADWQACEAQLNVHRTHVHTQFAAIVANRQALNSPLASKDNLEQQLYALISDDTRQTLDAFWGSKLIIRLTTEARKRLDTVWPLCVHTILAQATSAAIDPNVACKRLLPLFEQVLRRSVYLVLLIENPQALSQLIQMISVSPWIANELSRYPVLLDEFLHASFFHLPNREELKNTLRQQLMRVEYNDVDSYMRELRLFKKSAVLAVATSDVLADRPLMKVSDALTDIAEVVLDKALILALHGLIERYGIPTTQAGTLISVDSPAFAIVAYGKFGGIEMSYGSDLDLVFIHNLDEQADTNGLKPISGSEFAAKLAQKIMSILSTHTHDGRVYEIDTRLRPSGHSGLLVTSLTGFANYQHKEAWLWEHQALVRARGITGDQAVIAEFTTLRHQLLAQVRDQQQTQQQVIDMRLKMLNHLGSGSLGQKNNTFNLKHDIGGIVDIEFMAQYCVLMWGCIHPSITLYSDNVRILQAAIEATALSSQEANQLTECYLALRGQMHKLALAEQSIIVSAEPWEPLRAMVQTVWHRLMGSHLMVSS